jgi:hypothetical protein
VQAVITTVIAILSIQFPRLHDNQHVLSNAYLLQIRPSFLEKITVPTIITNAFQEEEGKC